MSTEKILQEIAESMPFMQSVQEFQDELTFPFLEALIEGTTDGVTVSVDAETVELALSEATLHLTNHKDIVLDPSLVNVARMGNGYSSTEIGIFNSKTLRLLYSSLVSFSSITLFLRNSLISLSFSNKL